jgi:imidazolonepropionase-like amidohydrolase
VTDAYLFREANVFDGRSATLIERADVLVEGDTITAVHQGRLDVAENVAIIDCTGRTLMPGLIDLHTHPSFNLPVDRTTDASLWLRGMSLAKTLEMYLAQGFTTIRETGGACTAETALACDRGLVAGPRLYPSGAFLSQTSGHGDFRRLQAPHPGMTACCGDISQGGFSYLVDGPDEVRKAARENLRRGATQLKIMAGGGVASPTDPIHTTQFRPEEIRAAVEVAEDWGTYVTAHLYHDRSARRCIENGVRCIEHGHLLSEETVELCADRGIPIVGQAVTYTVMSEIGPEMGLGTTNLTKNTEIVHQIGRLFGLIRERGVQIGFSSDLIGGQQHQVNREFVLRTPYFSNLEILRQATAESADILRLCGPLNRYGRFGEVREGWLADLIVVDGNPLEDVGLLEDHGRRLTVIMKGGRIYKNLSDRIHPPSL